MASRSVERLVTGFAPRYIKLNKELQSVPAVDLEQLIADKLPQFNAVNLVTALHRLATVGTSTLPKATPTARKVYKRLVAVLPQDPDCTAHAWSNACWAIAKLRLPAHPMTRMAVDYITATSAAHDETEGSCTKQELANILWALARLREPAAPQLVTRVIDALPPAKPTTDARHIGGVCSAFGNLATVSDGDDNDTKNAKHAVPHASAVTRYVAEAGVAITQSPQRFSPQQMCNIVWASAKVRAVPLPSVDAVPIHQCNAQELALLLWSCASTGTAVKTPLVDKIVTRLVAQQPNSQDVATSTWALVKLSGPQMHIDALTAVPSLLNAPPRHIATVAHALAQMPAEDIGPHGRAFLYRVAHMDGESILSKWPMRSVANAVYALAKTRTNGPLCATLCHSWTPPADLPMQECANVLWACATMRVSGPLVATVEGMLVPVRMRPEELASSAWAFTALMHTPTLAWRTACADAAMETMAQYKPQELGILLRALSKLQMPTSRVFDVAASNLLTRSDVAQWRGRDVIECLCAFEIDVPQVASRLAENLRVDDGTVDDLALARWFSALGSQRLRLEIANGGGHSGSSLPPLLERARAMLRNPQLHARVLYAFAQLNVPQHFVASVVPTNVNVMPRHDVITACYAWCLWHHMPPLWLLRCLADIVVADNVMDAHLSTHRKSTYQLQLVCLAMFGRGCLHFCADGRAAETLLQHEVVQTLRKLHYAPKAEGNASGLLVDIIL